MNVIKTRISDLYVVESSKNEDTRGAFSRLFCSKELNDLLNGRQIKQVNQSWTSKKGAIRGLHFQYPPYAEIKLVRCLRGCVWDIAIDLRKDSPTYLSWHAEILSPDNSLMMVIPEGFAHGFQTMENDSELLYLHTNFYNQRAEGGLRFDDSSLAINWPIPVTDISARDQQHPLINLQFQGIKL